MIAYYRKTKTHLMSLLLCILIGGSAYAQSNTLLILDASGSMRGRVEGVPKMKIAKDVICDYINSLSPNINAGLIVYGHRAKGDCDDIEYSVPLGKDNRQQMISTIRAIKPKGKTPIAKSLDKAVAILDEHSGANKIILVSDGRESCKAKPCSLIENYISQGKTFVTHVIGFDVDQRAHKQLKCIADAGNGTYFPVDDINGLKVAFQTVKKDQPVQILDTPKKSTPLKTGTIILQKNTFTAGEKIWVTFSTPDVYDAKAWIGIIPSDVPHGSEKTNDNHDATYQYMIWDNV